MIRSMRFLHVYRAFRSEEGMEKEKACACNRDGIGGGIFGGRPHRHRCELRTGNPHAMAIFAAYKSAERACRGASHPRIHARTRTPDNAVRWPWDTGLIGVCRRPMQFNLCCITSQSYVHQSVRDPFRSCSDFLGDSSRRRWAILSSQWRLRVSRMYVYVYRCARAQVNIHSQT